MRYLLTFAVLLIASAAQVVEAATLATYSAAVSAMSTEAIVPNSIFRIELFNEQTRLDYRDYPYRALESGIGIFALNGPDFLRDGNADQITFRLTPLAGGTAGEFSFDELQLAYAYPHAGVDFLNEALVPEIDYRLIGVQSQGRSVDATVEFKFIGWQIDAVPEPASWLLFVIGAILLWWRVHYLKVHLDRPVE